MRFTQRLKHWNQALLGLPRKAALIASTLLFLHLCLLLWPSVWPFAASLLLSCIIEPFVRLATKGFLRLKIAPKHCREISAALGIFLFLGLFGAAGTALLGWLLAELAEWLSNLPALLTHMKAELLRELCNRWKPFFPWELSGLFETLGQNVVRLAGALSTQLTVHALNTAFSAPYALLGAMLTITGAYYYTVDHDRIVRFYRHNMPSSLASRISQLLGALRCGLLEQLRSQLLLSTMVAFFLMITLGVSNVQHGSLIGLLIGLADALPLLGAGVFLLPWSFVSFLSGSAAKGTMLLCLFAGTVLIRQILEPHITGKRLGLYPPAALAAMYAACQLMGLKGLLLGPIALIACKTVLNADQPVTGTPPSARPPHPNARNAL